MLHYTVFMLYKDILQMEKSCGGFNFVMQLSADVNFNCKKYYDIKIQILNTVLHFSLLTSD